MEKIKFSVKNYLDAHQELFKKISSEEIDNAISLIKSKFISGSKIITCGNGGSAYTASHYITDWNKMINIATGKQFKGISLCDNIGLLTAFGNDISYDEVFAGQLKSILSPEDLLITVSGSGNSPNVLRAIEYANSVGADTLAIVGYDGGKSKLLSKKSVWINSFDMQLCEDLHLMFGHMVMKELCNTDIRI
jgi:D-sedoheptulose 7-phosphate isomerase